MVGSGQVSERRQGQQENPKVKLGVRRGLPSRRGLVQSAVTRDLVPLLNQAAGKGAKANMASTGPHWLESWTLPLAFGTRGVLGGDF